MVGLAAHGKKKQDQDLAVSVYRLKFKVKRKAVLHWPIGIKRYLSQAMYGLVKSFYRSALEWLCI